MQRASDEFLSGSAFAPDQNRDVSIRNPMDEVADLVHLLAAAEQLTDGRGFAGMRPCRR